MKRLLMVAMFVACVASAQEAKKGGGGPGFPDGPGKDVLLAKCFQCHGPNMWSRQRQDRRAWESTLYRMVGRGALWSEEEIRQMADYLGNVYGKNAK